MSHRGVNFTYSVAGPNLWLCAPSGGMASPISSSTSPRIVTTTNYSRYINSFNGTSAAAPVVSGVVALIRSVDPALSWRDVKLILAASAQKTDSTAASWRSGASKYGSATESYSYSNKYGFGVVDASSAVALARNWTSVLPMREVSSATVAAGRTIPDDGTIVESIVRVATDMDFVEYVYLNVDLDAPAYRHLRIKLQSPSGAVSSISRAQNTYCDTTSSCGFTGSYRFGIARHLGENPNGEWTLKVSDEVPGRSANVLRSWSVEVFGHRNAPEPVPLVHVTPGDGKLAVAWDAPSSQFPVTSYEVRHIRSDAVDKSDANWTLIKNAATPQSRVFTISGLANDSARDVQVRAVDPRAGGWSATVRGTPAANSRPFFVEGAQTERAVDETAAVGTALNVPAGGGGWLEAFDADGDVLTYSLGGADSAVFAIDALTGVLSTATALDFAAHPNYRVAVEVRDNKDGAGRADTAVDDTIDVRVAEARALPTLTGPASVGYFEGRSDAVASFQATDADNRPVALRLGGPDAAAFELSSGTLRFVEVPDFENRRDADRDNIYRIEIVAPDGDRARVHQFSVIVRNVNEPATITGPTSVTVAENSTAEVGSYAAADPDGWHGRLSVEGDDGHLFSIRQKTLRFNGAPDFENPHDAPDEASATHGGDNTYHIEIFANPVTGGPRSMLPVSIVVTDVDEAPVIAGPAAVAFSENSTATIASYAATDPDDTEITWTLGGADRSRFTIDGGAVSFVSAPDFETPADTDRDNVYHIDVTATDGTTAVAVPVSVSLTDVDEPAAITNPHLTLNGATSISFAENDTSPVTVFVAEGAAANPPTWTLGGTDAGRFVLNRGRLKFSRPPDFENPADSNRDNVYEVAVSVSNGTTSRSVQATVTVTDQNETPLLRIAATPTHSISTQENNLTVKTIKALDPESDRLTWSVGGVDARFFNPLPRFGRSFKLKFMKRPWFNNPLDANNDNTYEITLFVTDGALYHSTPVSVTVTRDQTLSSQDTPYWGPTVEGASPAIVPENSNYVVGQYWGADPKGKAVTWSLPSHSEWGDNKLVVLDNAGRIRFISPPDFENPRSSLRYTPQQPNTYTVLWRASNGTLQGVGSKRIIVTDADDPGVLTLPNRRPLVGTLIRASLTDPDRKVRDISWVWERSSNRADWITIPAANTRKYVPQVSDLHQWLRATASYTDKHSNNATAQTVSLHPVRNSPNTP